MIDNDLARRLGREIQNLIPLFRYLVLQTQTHAFCLALAAAALLGFYPACLVVLAVFKNVLQWEGAYNVMLERVLKTYFPISQDFVIDNLRNTLRGMSHGSSIGSLLWVLLGAAGIFVPLETALNRLWQVQEDRPYWMNQIVGFSLTIACTFVALFCLAIATTLHQVVGRDGRLIQQAVHFIITRVTMTGFFMVTVFALYKFLPNTRIDARQVMPAAILAGVIAEIVRVIFVSVVPDLQATHGPFFVSVTFLLLIYFETFVILGCAFLASRAERYPWIGFLPRKRVDQSSSPS